MSLSYNCVFRVLNLPLSTLFLLDFVIVPTVESFFPILLVVMLFYDTVALIIKDYKIWFCNLLSTRKENYYEVKVLPVMVI